MNKETFLLDLLAIADKFDDLGLLKQASMLDQIVIEETISKDTIEVDKDSK